MLKPSHAKPDSTSPPLDPRSEAIVSAILTLVNSLSEAEKSHVLKQVTDRLRPIPLPRAGDVLNTVVQLIPRERSWTVREIKARVEEEGAAISDKELYNAVGYLARRQHIQRLGHGRYVINGIGIVTGDDFGGQPSITESDLDD